MKNKVSVVLIIIGLLFMVEGQTNGKKSTEKAMIDLSPNKPVQKLFSLTLISINGESVIHREDMVMLKPGHYELKFASNIDLNYFSESSRILKTKINQRKFNDSIELKVEAGNIYHLAFDARSRKVEDWKPILLNTTVD